MGESETVASGQRGAGLTTCQSASAEARCGCSETVPKIENEKPAYLDRRIDWFATAFRSTQQRARGLNAAQLSAMRVVLTHGKSTSLLSGCSGFRDDHLKCAARCLLRLGLGDFDPGSRQAKVLCSPGAPCPIAVLKLPDVPASGNPHVHLTEAIASGQPRGHRISPDRVGTATIRA